MRVAIFGGPVVFKGTHIIKCRNFTPSVSRGVGKLSAKAKSVVLLLRVIILIINRRLTENFGKQSR